MSLLPRFLFFLFWLCFRERGAFESSAPESFSRATLLLDRSSGESGFDEGFVEAFTVFVDDDSVVAVLSGSSSGFSLRVWTVKASEGIF